jgi:hypothetical protein
VLLHHNDSAAGQLGADFWHKLAQFGAPPLLELAYKFVPGGWFFLVFLARAGHAKPSEIVVE